MRKNIYPLIFLGTVVLYEGGQEYDAFPLEQNNPQSVLSAAEAALVRSWTADIEENRYA